MKHLIPTIFAVLLLTGCQKDQPGASTETSPSGIAYARLYIPDTDQVAIQIAWPSTWAFQEGANQAVPYIGADLILAGGAEGFPAGQVVETFADLKANGNLWATPDYLFGQLVVPKENLDKAVEIAAAHLAKPTLDQGWFDRVQQGLTSNMTESSAQPANLGFDALRWAILGDTPLRRALSVNPPNIITAATRDEVADWHTQTMTRTAPKIVIAGDISAETAGMTVDKLMAGLPDQPTAAKPAVAADFSARRILLHVPTAQTSTLVFIGRLPPTRDGGETEDYVLSAMLGGDDQSILFDAVRTGLRASYGFGAGIDAYTRDTRLLVLSGEVETTKLAEAEGIVRAAYSQFKTTPELGNLDARLQPIRAGAEQTAKDPATAAYSALLAMLDNQDPGTALQLASVIDKVNVNSVTARLSAAFPPADGLIVLAVSPDATALPGACVITTPAEAVNCR